MACSADGFGECSDRAGSGSTMVRGPQPGGATAAVRGRLVAAQLTAATSTCRFARSAVGVCEAVAASRVIAARRTADIGRGRPSHTASLRLGRNVWWVSLEQSTDQTALLPERPLPDRGKRQIEVELGSPDQGRRRRARPSLPSLPPQLGQGRRHVGGASRRGESGRSPCLISTRQRPTPNVST